MLADYVVNNERFEASEASQLSKQRARPELSRSGSLSAFHRSNLAMPISHAGVSPLPQECD